MTTFVIFAIGVLAYFCSLPSAILLRNHPNIGTLYNIPVSNVCSRRISLLLHSSPMDETPEYVAELDRLQKLKSDEFLCIVNDSDISLKGLNDRKELERILALEIVLRRKTVTSSPRSFAQELQKELASLQPMSISSIKENLHRFLGDIPENATEHELRVLLARSNIERNYRNQQKIIPVPPTKVIPNMVETVAIEEEIYLKDVLYNAEKAFDSVANGFITGMNSIRNFTGSVSSTAAEQDAFSRFTAESRLSGVPDKDKSPQNWLQEVTELTTFDDIMSWCAAKPRNVIIDVLRELKVPVGRYMTYSAACTSLADYLMTVRQESTAKDGADYVTTNDSNDGLLERRKALGKIGKKKVVGDYAFEKDIWRRFAKKTIPNTIVGTTNFIAEMLTLVTTSIASVFKFHGPGGNHPVTLLEKLLQLLCTATAALSNALGLWAGSGRLSSRSVISLAVIYTIYRRKGIGGFLNAIMVTKLFTSFFNSLGIPAIFQTTTTAKVKLIETPRDEEEEDWSDEAFGST